MKRANTNSGQSSLGAMIALILGVSSLAYFSSTILLGQRGSQISADYTLGQTMATELLEFFASGTLERLQKRHWRNPASNATTPLYLLCSHINILDRTTGNIVNRDDIAALGTNPLDRTGTGMQANRFYMLQVIDIQTLAYRNDLCGSEIKSITLGPTERMYISVGVTWIPKGTSTTPRRVILSTVLKEGTPAVPAPEVDLTGYAQASGAPYVQGPVSLPLNTKGMLRLNVRYANSCTVTPGLATFSNGAAFAVNYANDVFTGLTPDLNSPITFHAVCTNTTTGISSSDTFTFNVATVNLMAREFAFAPSDGPITVVPNTVIYLTWASTGTTGCTVNPGAFNAPNWSPPGATYTVNADTTFTITCTTGSGNITDSVQVDVGDWQPLTSAMSCPQLCTSLGLTNKISPDGFRCTSGERRSGSALARGITFPVCWGCGNDCTIPCAGAGPGDEPSSIAPFPFLDECYSPTQLQDHDATDTTRGCFCG